MPAALAAVAALAAATTLWAAGSFSPGKSSRAAFVSPRCNEAGNKKACAVALRYLAALDLDRAEQACELLEQPTLKAAGGLAECAKTLLLARGIRIRYSIDDVRQTPLGKTIRFSTQGTSTAPFNQEMLVSPRGRIVAVVPEP